MKTNIEILTERETAFNEIKGPRVGDYLYIPSKDDRVPEYTRFTLKWDTIIQTGGSINGDYYLGESGGLSYSGGLDPGVKITDLILTNTTKDGTVWFFDENWPRAGAGKTFSIPMRVYNLKEGADLRGLHHIRCPYQLTTLAPEMHGKTCGYWYTITKNDISHTAFKTKEELMGWLNKNKLALSQEVPEEKIFSYQGLNYI